MKQLKLLFLISLFSYPCFAQTGANVEISDPSNTNGYGAVRYNNPSALGGRQLTAINNDEITGNAFWKTNWNKALIFFNSNSAIKIQDAKLDLYSNSIYYLDSIKNIKVAETTNINRIIFIDKVDSMKILATFRKINYNGNNAFFLVLNSGTYQLMKLNRIDLRKSGYNTMAGKDEYSYDPQVEYYLFFEGNMKQLESLNKNNITSLISLSPQDEQWLTSNNNKLKGEAQAIDFFNYYNNK